jgi:acyl-CoA thioester hydrolase
MELNTLKDLKDLKDFHVQVKIPITENEMRDTGHVKNTCYVKYFESVRIQYLREIGFTALKSEEGTGTILAQTICKYLKPLAYPDIITVGARVKSMGASSFVLEYMIVSEKMGVAASGEEVVVIYDYTNSKKTELPLAIKESIGRIERWGLSV